LRAIKAHRLLFALIIVICVGGAITGLKLKTGAYEAHARVLMTPVPSDDRTFLGVQLIRDTGDPTRTAQTAATLLEARDAATLTAARLGPDRTPSQVAAAVSVESIGESNVLAVRATAASPDLAARSATEYARAALTVRARTIRAQIERLIASLQLQQRAIGDASSTAASDLALRIAQLRTALAQGDPTLSFQQAAGQGIAIGPPAWLVLTLATLAGITLSAAAVVLLKMTRTRIRD